MFSIIKNCMEFVAAIVILISIKSPIDVWLLLACSAVVLLAGFFKFIKGHPFVGGIEVMGSLAIFLQIFRVGHPAVSIFFGIALFMIAIPSIAGLLMQ